MTGFPSGEITQIGVPIGTSVERPGVSRSDAAGVIVASLVSLKIYPRSNELADVIGEEVKQFGAAKADVPADTFDVAVRYSVDLDSEVLTADSLRARYKAAGHKIYEPWQPLWSQFTDVELNKRLVGEEVSEPEHPFQGRIVGWLQAGNHPTEIGLDLVKKTWSEQQQAAMEKINAYAAAGRTKTALWLPSYGDFIMAYAAEAEAYDGVVLDGSTAARLVQHDMRAAGGGSCGPHVSSHGGGLYSDGSRGRAGPGRGVRFLMGQTNLEA